MVILCDDDVHTGSITFNDLDLTTCSISLHAEFGQKEDIEDYIRSVLYSGSVTKRWRKQDRDLVIVTLSEKADGMYVDCVKFIIHTLTVK